MDDEKENPSKEDSTTENPFKVAAKSAKSINPPQKQLPQNKLLNKNGVVAKKPPKKRVGVNLLSLKNPIKKKFTAPIKK